MNKPDDVSQWAWDEAIAIYNGLHAPNLYNSEESLADYEKAEDVADIARVLDATLARIKASSQTEPEHG